MPRRKLEEIPDFDVQKGTSAVDAVPDFAQFVPEEFQTTEQMEQPKPVVAPAPKSAPKPVTKPTPAKVSMYNFSDMPTEQLFDDIPDLIRYFKDILQSLTDYSTQIRTYNKTQRFSVEEMGSKYSKEIKRARDTRTLAIFQNKIDADYANIQNNINIQKPNLSKASPMVLDFEKHWDKAVQLRIELRSRKNLNTNQRQKLSDLEAALKPQGRDLIESIKKVNEAAETAYENVLAYADKKYSALKDSINLKQGMTDTESKQGSLDQELELHRFECQMSQAQQETVEASVNTLFSGFGPAQRVALRSLSDVIMACIAEEINFGDIQEFGVGGDFTIVINGTPMSISGLRLTNAQLSHFCKRDAQAIIDGRYASCFDFADMQKFPNLVILDLQDAPVEVITTVARDLGVDKGRWGKLFKRRILPNLQAIRLPEGTVTRENSGVWGKFKSNAEYTNLVNAARNKTDSFAGNQSATNPNTMREAARSAPAYNPLPTIKDAVWGKPLPKILVKTFGYGMGVPVYWGLMTALGPFGMVMGALGIGAMAKMEYNKLKENKS